MSAVYIGAHELANDGLHWLAKLDDYDLHMICEQLITAYIDAHPN